MLQGVSVSLVAWGRYYNDFGGQVLVIFIITVAACEAAIALALVLMLFQRSGRLDIAIWQELARGQPAAVRRPGAAEDPSPAAGSPQCRRRACSRKSPDENGIPPACLICDLLLVLIPGPAAGRGGAYRRVRRALLGRRSQWPWSPAIAAVAARPACATGSTCGSRAGGRGRGRTPAASGRRATSTC